MSKWVAPAGARVYNKQHAKYIVAGDFLDDDEADLLVCSLKKFDLLMRRQYPDWEDFLYHLGRKYGDGREWYVWMK